MTFQNDRNVKRLSRSLQNPTLLFVWWATPCNTMSRARKDDGGPPPLRSDAYPLGIPGLQGAQLRKVQQANRLVTVTALGLELAHSCGAASVLENPHRSRLWEIPRLLAALQRIGAASVFLDYCCWGERWQKRTRLAGTLRGLRSLQRACAGRWTEVCSISGLRHISLVGKDASGVFWTLGAQPYPHALCDDIAALVNAGLDAGTALHNPAS